MPLLLQLSLLLLASPFLLLPWLLWSPPEWVHQQIAAAGEEWSALT
jgi:hypothetical protein